MGTIAKYRVMMIGGWLYPLHLAISAHWKIHYVTADMTENAEHRAEEAKFLRGYAGRAGPACDGGAGGNPERAGPGLRRHRLWLERRRRRSAVRSQRHHDRAAARAGTGAGTTGAPPSSASKMPCAKCWSTKRKRQVDATAQQIQPAEPTIYWQPVQELEARKCSIVSFLSQSCRSQ